VGLNARHLLFHGIREVGLEAMFHHDLFSHGLKVDVVVHAGS